MAMLLRRRDGARFDGGTPSLLGRDESCDLILTDSRVSQHHARLTFDGEGWHFEDLGSRNGSSINGRPAAPGGTAILSVGDVLVLGTPAETWEVHRLGPPPLLARSAAGVTTTGSDYLGLPTADEPVATVYQRNTGRWVIEMPEGVRSVSHREQVIVGGTVWRLFLPGTTPRTLEDQDRQLGIEEIRLCFTVSSDEEAVEIVLEHGERRTPLKTRSHHYMLLTLARERLRDAAQAGVPIAEQGWVYQEDLCRMLGLEASVVYLQVHRARRQLEAAGVVRAFDLVERRTGSGQIRLGVSDLSVERTVADD
ncbi:MAG: FHA domain-containing protein [Myxococcota bacterium]|nr:FHA domain-containing protein [Myxococcota bacterium]MEC8424916.1 FHA domain-containing protein [Myxococcota bacterium]